MSETATVGFSYVPVDPSSIPSRPRPMSPGRPSHNPHTEVLAKYAGSGEAFAFVDNAPDDEDERTKLYNRHVRYLRLGAHENGRGVRCWREDLEDGRLKVNVLDTPYFKRKKDDDDAADVATDDGSNDVALSNDYEGSDE